MPFVSALLGGLLVFLGESLTRWLVSLGASFVVYRGVDTLLQGLISSSVAYWDSLPVHILQILSLAGIDEALSIGLSGVAFHMTMNLVGKKILTFKAS